MDTAWIQVFVLTLAECVAPAGKTVCQERQFELQFLTRADCEFALQQLVSLKQSADNVIVDAGKSRCVVSAREGRVFASVDAVNQPFGEGASKPSRNASGMNDKCSRLRNWRALASWLVAWRTISTISSPAF